MTKSPEFASWEPAPEASLGGHEVLSSTAGVGAAPHSIISPLDEDLPPLHLLLVQRLDHLLPALLGLQVHQSPPRSELVQASLDGDHLASMSLHQSLDILVPVARRQISQVETASLRAVAILLNVADLFAFPASLGALHLDFIISIVIIQFFGHSSVGASDRRTHDFYFFPLISEIITFFNKRSQLLD